MEDNKKVRIKKNIMILIGIFIYAIAIKFFFRNTGLVTKGFVGVSLLVVNIFNDYLHITIPLTLVNILINIIPAILVYHIIGKKFAIVSFINTFAATFIADLLPSFLVSNELLLCSIFGGILEGFGMGLMLKAGASSGGTDYIAMLISHKFHRSAFNYILIFNCLLIMTEGLIYGFNLALYSIICAYVSTQVINMMYKNYDKSTLLIITEKPDEIANRLVSLTKHSATKFSGVGCYSHKDKYLLYMVLTDPEIKSFLREINAIDPQAFTNVFKSNAIYGNFSYLPIGQ